MKQLHGFDPPQYRLRIGDWRVIFRKVESIEIVRVRNRREVAARAVAASGALDRPVGCA